MGQKRTVYGTFRQAQDEPRSARLIVGTTLRPTTFTLQYTLAKDDQRRVKPNSPQINPWDNPYGYMKVNLKTDSTAHTRHVRYMDKSIIVRRHSGAYVGKI